METTARVRQIARDVLGYPELRPGQLDAAAALAGLFSPGERVTYHQWDPGLIFSRHFCPACLPVPTGPTSGAPPNDVVATPTSRRNARN